MLNTHLLIIDPQEDFCDPDGALYVTGAVKDMERLGVFISKNVRKINRIHCTLDSHHHVGIERPSFWMGQDGKQPDPFTIITSEDVKNGVWRPKKFSLIFRVQEYVDALEANQRYPLCVWTQHCEIGKVGATIVQPINDAFDAWTEEHFRTINFVAKGSNPMTEHYSGVQADVPDPSDPGSQINTNLIKTLETADEILLAGEASSHCLANTVKDIADNFGDDSYTAKFTLLEDACSPVQGFENLAESFVFDMKARGMKVSTTVDWMAQ